MSFDVKIRGTIISPNIKMPDIFLLVGFSMFGFCVLLFTFHLKNKGSRGEFIPHGEHGGDKIFVCEVRKLTFSEKAFHSKEGQHKQAIVEWRVFLQAILLDFPDVTREELLGTVHHVVLVTFDELDRVGNKSCSGCVACGIYMVMELVLSAGVLSQFLVTNAGGARIRVAFCKAMKIAVDAVKSRFQMLAIIWVRPIGHGIESLASAVPDYVALHVLDMSAWLRIAAKNALRDRQGLDRDLSNWTVLLKDE